MELGRALTQQPGRRHVRADQRAGQWRDVPLRQGEQGLVGHRGVLPALLGASSRKVVVEGLQRVPPGIPLVRHEAVEDAYGGRFPGVPVVLEGPGHRGDVGEGRPLGEKASELQVRVHAFGDTPKELEDQPLPVDDRGIALLGCQRSGDQEGISRAPKVGEHLGREGAQRPCHPRHVLAVGDGRQHGFPQRVIPPGLAQQPLRLRPPHPGDDGLG